MKKDQLPAEFVTYIRQLWLHDRSHNIRRVHRWLIIRWTLWLDGNPENALPGYTAPPPAVPATGLPAGWSLRKFTDIARETIGTAAHHSINPPPTNKTP